MCQLKSKILVLIVWILDVCAPEYLSRFISLYLLTHTLDSLISTWKTSCPSTCPKLGQPSNSCDRCPVPASALSSACWNCIYSSGQIQNTSSLSLSLSLFQIPLNWIFSSLPLTLNNVTIYLRALHPDTLADNQLLAVFIHFYIFHTATPLDVFHLIIIWVFEYLLTTIVPSHYIC